MPSDSDETGGQGRPLGELIPEVFELQQAWSSDNAPEMQQRGTLVRRLLPAAIRSLLPSEGTLPFTTSIEGSELSGWGDRTKVLLTLSSAIP